MIPTALQIYKDPLSLTEFILDGGLFKISYDYFFAEIRNIKWGYCEFLTYDKYSLDKYSIVDKYNEVEISPAIFYVFQKFKMIVPLCKDNSEEYYTKNSKDFSIDNYLRFKTFYYKVLVNSYTENTKIKLKILEREYKLKRILK